MVIATAETTSTTVPSRLPIADLEIFAARHVESAWLAETGADPESGCFGEQAKFSLRADWVQLSSCSTVQL
jgi:hypothetical protein